MTKLTEDQKVAIYEDGPNKLPDAERLDLAIRYIFELREQNMQQGRALRKFCDLTERMQTAMEAVYATAIARKRRTNTRI